MSVSKYYIGITIGPIFETISDASNPASLWFASSIFSDLTLRLCRSISNEFRDNECNIYSPYYDPEEDINDGADNSDGIGKYHDRIIFSLYSDNEDKLTDSLDVLVKKVKGETSKYFPQELEASEDFFEKYIQVKYVILPEDAVGENCVLTLSPYLDELELMATVNPYDRNPFYDLFISRKQDDGGAKGRKDDKSANDIIKESCLLPKNSKIIDTDGSIYSIEEIANSITRKNDSNADEDNLKYRKYFAVVSADGDGMTNFLKSISSDIVPDFSHMCLNYATQACKDVFDFGGMAIYAGGDDLLFLAPVLNEKKESIFDLCLKISKAFETNLKSSEKLRDNHNLPTLSFGVSIQYMNYPLYEALEHSRELLKSAKNLEENKKLQKPYKKNFLAVNLTKHSGQSLDLILGNELTDKVKDIVIEDETETDSKNIQSILYIISEYKELIYQLDKCGYDRETYLKVFLNLFDNAGQKASEDYIKEIIGKYYDNILHGTENRIFSSVPADKNTDKTQIEKESYWILVNILRFRKFLKEKAGDMD